MFYCPHCSQLSTIMFSIVPPNSGLTILFHIVENCEQCGQQNIVFNPVIQQTQTMYKTTRLAAILALPMDNLHYRLIFYIHNKNEIPRKNLLKVVKYQHLVEKCLNEGLFI